jgi:hypothetical protein
MNGHAMSEIEERCIAQKPRDAEEFLASLGMTILALMARTNFTRGNP